MKTYTYEKTTINLMETECRLHRDTLLERFFQLGIIVTSVTLIVCFLDEVNNQNIPYPVLILLLLSILYGGIKSGFVIDNNREQLHYSRSFFGIEHRYKVCNFNDIQCVTTNARYVPRKFGSYYEYNVTAIQKTGAIFHLTNNWCEEQGAGACVTVAKMLAEHFGVKYLEGRSDCCVTATESHDGTDCRVIFESANFRAYLRRIVMVVGIFVIVSIIIRLL